VSYSAEILRLEGVKVRYADSTNGHVLLGVTFALSDEPGMVALVGPNGSGKTTILQTIIGRLEVDEGKLLLGGADITRTPTHLRTGLGCVFQRALDGMCMTLTVEENLSLMMMGKGPSVVQPLVSPRRKKMILSRATRVLEEVSAKSRILSNLTGVLDRYPNEFSGGEAQQLCLLALLLQNPLPALVLADEPTLNLDRENRIACLRLLEGLARVTAVLVATHDQELVSRCSRTVEIEKGRVSCLNG
jgi:ABC-type lipoprotein export system ATPase subunit